MDNKRQTTPGNESSKTITHSFQETNSERGILANSDYEKNSETHGSNKCIEFSSGQQILEIVKQLGEIIPKIHDVKIKEQVKKLEFVIRYLLEIAQLLKGDIPIPPLYADITEENFVLIEWIFPDFRVGFNIEANPSESGVYIVSGENLDEFIYSEKLRNMREILLVFRYILSNL